MNQERGLNQTARERGTSVVTLLPLSETKLAEPVPASLDLAAFRASIGGLSVLCGLVGAEVDLNR